MKQLYMIGMGMLSTSLSMAQEYRFGAEAAVHTSSSSMTFAGSDAFAEKNRLMPALSAGVSVSRSLGKESPWSLASGLYFEWYVLHNRFDKDSLRIGFRNNLTVLDIPLEVQYTSDHRTTFFAGVGIQVPVYAQQISTVTTAAETYETVNNTYNMIRPVLPVLRAGWQYRFAAQWSVLLYYKYLPGGLFRADNYNNQHFGAMHTLGLGIRYWKY